VKGLAESKRRHPQTTRYHQLRQNAQFSLKRHIRQDAILPHAGCEFHQGWSQAVLHHNDGNGGLQATPWPLRRIEKAVQLLTTDYCQIPYGNMTIPDSFLQWRLTRQDAESGKVKS
jgi:hypothetical protein